MTIEKANLTEDEMMAVIENNYSVNIPFQPDVYGTSTHILSLGNFNKRNTSCIMAKDEDTDTYYQYGDILYYDDWDDFKTMTAWMTDGILTSWGLCLNCGRHSWIDYGCKECGAY
jgi:hypothetical protein